MTNTLKILCAAGALALSNSVFAQTDYTFTPFSGNSGAWNNPANWSPTGTPEELDSATIPSGKTCNITSAVAEIDSITVAGTLNILDGNALVIYGDNNSTSTVNGTVAFDVAGAAAGSPTIQLASVLEIDGTGQIVARRASGNTDFGVIAACPDEACSQFLTIGPEIEIAGSVKFDSMILELVTSGSDAAKLVVDSVLDEMIIGSDPDVDNFLVFKGEGELNVSAGTATFANTTWGTPCLWNINVNGGIVAIDDDSYLTGTDMLIEINSGGLSVETDLSIASLTMYGGSAAFDADLIDGNVTVTAGTLTFNAACAPSGPFTISGGTVDWNAALSGTTAIGMSGGTLRFDAASTPAGTLTFSGGTVYVTDNVTAGDIVWSGGTFNVSTSKSISFDQ